MPALTKWFLDKCKLDRVMAVSHSAEMRDSVSVRVYGDVDALVPKTIAAREAVPASQPLLLLC